MAIRDGLLGNPVLSGLLARGGPVAIQQAANQQIARMQQRPQAARLRAPGAINLPPDNSVGQGLSQLGKALGDIADMKEQGAAKKDLADLYGQTTTVQEPGTGQTASVPRQVTSGDIYKLMGKYINNPSIQKSLGLQAQRLALEEREKRQANLRRDLQRNQIISTEGIADKKIEAASRTLATKLNAQIEAEKLKFNRNLYRDTQNNAFKMELEQYRADNRSSEKALDRLNDYEIAVMKRNNIKPTNQGLFVEGKLKGTIYNSGEGPVILNKDGKYEALSDVVQENPGFKLLPLAETTESSASKKLKGTLAENVERAGATVKAVSNVLKEITENPGLVGLRGDLYSKINNAGQIFKDFFGESGITRLTKGLVGGDKSAEFLNSLDSKTEMLFESMIALRSRAKGSRPIGTELEELKKLTKLDTWTSQEKILTNIEELQRRLKEDFEIIKNKEEKITGKGTSTKSNSFGSGTTKNGLDFQWREVTD